GGGVGGGYRRIGFSGELRTTAFSLADGSLISDTNQDLPTLPALHLGEASAALVYDNSVFGATSPIYGQRYRLEATPTFGSLNFTGVLGDYRRHFLLARPYTLAFRALHYGRYGRDSEDSRLFPLFLGDPGLVRGYDYNSFDESECRGDLSRGCPTFDRLLGSRLLVGSV